MVSDQFKRDYRQMVSQGVEFTPEDIIRLNALSVKTRRAATSAREVYLPRLAFLPRDHWLLAPIVLREPTIAHDLWLERAAQHIDTGKVDNFLFVHGYALSRRPGKLADAESPRAVIRAVYRFATRRLCHFTRGQMLAAVEYALFGNDWTVGERGPRKGAGTTDTTGGGGTPPLPETAEGGAEASPTIGLLTDGRMLRLGITTEDAKGMTSSELSEAINRAWDLDRRFDAKRATARAFGEYVRAREEIRARGRKDMKGRIAS